MQHGHRCLDFTTTDHRFYGVGAVLKANPAEADEVGSTAIYDSTSCALQNLWGAIGHVSAFEADPNEPYRLDVAGDSQTWHADGTDTTLSLRKNGGSRDWSRYSIAITRKHLSRGTTSYYQDSENQWLRRLNVPAPDPPLRYADGSLVEVKGAFITTNGRYVALDVYQRGLAVYDTYTKSITTALDKYGYNNTFTELSLSEDGRYLMVAGRLRATDTGGTSHDVLLIDTSCCPSVPLSTIASSSAFANTGCPTLDLEQYVNDNYKPITTLGRVWTNPNANQIVVRAGVIDDDGVEQETLSLTPKNDTTPAGYLAMGDSYSSGEGDSGGADWYEPDTDNHGDDGNSVGRNLCHLSRRSYPYLIARQLGYDTFRPGSNESLFHSVACSGAKIHNVIGGSLGEKHTPGAPREFARTDNQYIYSRTYGLREWQPGSTKQTNSIIGGFFSPSTVARKANPEIITIGIGGNDAGFGDFLSSCFWPGNCPHTDSNSDAAFLTGQQIGEQKRRLVDVFSQLKQHSDARIYVHGYPLLFTTDQSYCLNVPSSRAELRFMNHATTYLNQIIKTAAAEAGVYYVDVEDMLNGQRLCNRGQDVMNGLTAGDDARPFRFMKKVIGAESFHPTENGFKLYRNAITTQTNDLNAAMPEPQPELPIPLPDVGVFGQRAVEHVELLNETYDYTQVPARRSAEMVDNPLGDTSFDLDLSGLLPGATATIEAHSTPVQLGTFTVNDQGRLHQTITLPELEPGYHELRVKTTAIDGQLTDYYESFTLGYSDSDFDGDGIANNHDDCPTVVNANIDADGDNLDDACDGIISEQTVAARSQGSYESTPTAENSGSHSQSTPSKQTVGQATAQEGSDELEPNEPNATSQTSSNPESSSLRSSGSIKLALIIVGVAAALLLLAVIVINKRDPS